MMSYQGSKTNKSYITSPVCNKKPIKVLHLTAPDDKLTKQLFTQAAKERPGHHTFNTSSMSPSKAATQSLAGVNSQSKFFNMGNFTDYKRGPLTEDQQSVNLSKMGGSF